ncbi:hypothetical protein H2248_008384 [Termitomyces sp. 'cryptogamus']|nr:hypothetical protein H2248_008384 [Termitomyces sp. 'cryptogamus']
MSVRPNSAQHAIRQLKLVLPGGVITYYLGTLHEFWRVTQFKDSWGRTAAFGALVLGSGAQLPFMAGVRDFVLGDTSIYLDPYNHNCRRLAIFGGNTWSVDRSGILERYYRCYRSLRAHIWTSRSGSGTKSTPYMIMHD